MNFFKTNPFVRLLLSLIVGVLLQYYFAPNRGVILSLLSLSLITILLILFIKIPYNYLYVRGVVVTVFVISSGVYVANFKSSEYTHIDSGDEVLLMGEVTKLPDERERNYKTEILVGAYKIDNKWVDISSKVIAYIDKDTTLLNLNIGNKIIFYSDINSIGAPNNPFGFNYAKYLSHKQIFHIVYVKRNEWSQLSVGDAGIRGRASDLRQSIIKTFVNNKITGDNLSILSALSLGYKNTLNNEMRKAYSGAGVSHVLAVSGLHVGIVYLVLYFSLSWLTLLFSLKRLKYSIILIGLWGYAFLAGLSPSVLRATVMFTFVLVGFIFNKKVNIYNSLSASAFFLLLFNPFLLFDIGFQLSYVAVMGIVFFHPRIYGLISFRYKLLNWIWSLIVVSIAAQLATFPITVYHFHQFPTYFWIANIFITLSATVLISLSIVLVATSMFTAVSLVIGKLINIIIDADISLIHWVNDLPYSLMSTITFSTQQVLVLYVIMLSFAIWLVTKKYLSLIVSLMLVLWLGILGNIHYVNRQNQSAVCVYQANRETAIQFVSGSHSWWFTSAKANGSRINTLVNDGNTYWHTTASTCVDAQYINDTVIVDDNLYYNSGYWASQNANGLIINTKSLLPEVPKDTLRLDYAFVTGRPNFTFNDISEKIIFNKIIIDGSVASWVADKFLSNSKGVSVFYTKDKGAFITTIDSSIGQ